MGYMSFDCSSNYRDVNRMCSSSIAYVEYGGAHRVGKSTVGQLSYNILWVLSLEGSLVYLAVGYALRFVFGGRQSYCKVIDLKLFSNWSSFA